MCGSWGEFRCQFCSLPSLETHIHTKSRPRGQPIWTPGSTGPISFPEKHRMSPEISRTGGAQNSTQLTPTHPTLTPHSPQNCPQLAPEWTETTHFPSHNTSAPFPDRLGRISTHAGSSPPGSAPAQPPFCPKERHFWPFLNCSRANQQAAGR